MRELPGLPLSLLRILLPREWRDSVLSEIADVYDENIENHGHYFAQRSLWREITSGHWLTLHIEARRLRKSEQATNLSLWNTPMNSLLKDSLYATRLLKRSPGFSLVAVLTFALGIGATTAIFSVVNGVLLKPLPYRTPGQLVYVWDRLEWIGFPRASVAGPQITDLRQQATLFDGFASLRTRTSQVTGNDDPEEVDAAFVSANLFSLLGVDATIGRTFLTGEDVDGSGSVVILSHGIWQRQFGSDPEIIGQTVTLDGNPTTIIGVLPRNFRFQVHHSLSNPSGAEIWLPDQVDLASAPRGQHRFAVLARIKDGVIFDQAMAELTSLGEQHDEQWFGNNGFTYAAIPVQEDLIKGVRSTLLLLLAAVGVLLLIATANIATLMLARSQLRAREVAVRFALGATRGRIIWLAFVEVGQLAALGGTLGFLLAVLGLDTLVALAPDGLPRGEDVTVDGWIFAFTGLITLAVAGLCSLAPAFHNSNLKLSGALSESASRVAGLGSAMRIRNLIVIAEVAMSLVLMTGAGLLMRSLTNMTSADPGFKPENVLAVDISLPVSRYEDNSSRAVFFETLIERLHTSPGVVQATATGTLPLGYANRNQSDCRPDLSPEGEDAIMTDYMPVLPGYFSAMGIDLIAGRTFTDEDDERENAPFVAIIDEKLARHWPNGNAVGRLISHLGEDWTVVGVVKHARIEHVHEDDRPQIYTPHAQLPFRSMTVVIKSALDPETLVPMVRSTVSEIDGNQPIANVRTMDALVVESTAKQRFAATLMTAFALTGALLAVLGVYGVLSYTVTNRTREIGIRMALGARETRVLRLIVRQGLIVTAAGISVGLIGAFALSRVMSGLLFEISNVDPITFVTVPVTLFFVAGLACFLPARKASRVDPLTVLREE